MKLLGYSWDDLVASVTATYLDFKGKYILNEQTTTNMMSKGTVYRFDGVDDAIAGTDLTQVTGSSGLLQCRFRYTENGAVQVLFSSADTATNSYYIYFGIGGTGEVFLSQKNNDTNDTISSGIFLDDGSENVVTFISNGTEYFIYVNGIQADITVSSGSNSGDWFTETTLRDVWAIGTFRRIADSSPFAGEISEVMLGNFTPTAAQIKDLSANIPFKWQYGSQTLIVPSDDCADDDTANWTDVNSALTFDTDHYVLTVTTGATAASTSDEAALTVGKEYTATVLFKDGTGAGATASINALTNAGASLAVGTPITVGAAYAKASVTWIATETNNKVQLLVAANSVADGETVLIDEITTNALGAVALYDQTSISDSVWDDRANANHGAVTGASVLNYKGAHTDGVDLYTDRKLITPHTVTAKTDPVTLTIAELLTGIVTATQASGSTNAYTLPTGALTDAALGMAVNDSFDWVLINLSAAAADTITVTEGTAHTIVGNPIVASSHASSIDSASAQFRTRKTAANTFVTYRIA